LYKEKEEYSKTFSFHEKAIENYQKILPSNHPLLTVSYNNIGEVYQDTGNNEKVLLYYEKAREIRQKNTFSTTS
jgi:tetratricopeptide (TPR) repeat protein